MFGQNDTEKSLTLSTTDDTVDDDGEKVRLGFTMLPALVNVGNPNQATVSITDNDHPQVNFSFGTASYTAAEGGSAAVKVVLSADRERTVEVPITTTDMDGATAADYSGVPEKATFQSGETEKTFSFAATQDSVDDGEKVRLTFGILPTGVTSTAPSQAVVSFTDDAAAGVSVDPTTVTMNEGESREYTVVLDSEPIAGVTVTVAGTSGTGVSTDKTSVALSTINWSEKQMVNVSSVQDTDAVDESVTISHTVTSTDPKYSGASADSVGVTVNDDETVTKSLGLAMPDPVHGDIDTDGEVNLCDTLTYTATATNTGNVALRNITVSDLLVNTSGKDCASLAIGATCVLTVTHTVPQANVEADKVVNSSTASATGASTETVANEFSVGQVKALTMDKGTNASGYDQVGDVIQYTYTLTNSGTVALDGTLQIQDDKIASGNITCPAVPGNGMAPDQILTCAGSYTVVQSDVDAGEVVNQATATLDGVTSNEDTAQVSWRAPQGNQPQLSIGSGQVDEDDDTISLGVTLSPSSLQTVAVD